MAELLKNVYNDTFFDTFTKALQSVIPDLDIDKFMASVYVNDWKDKELKQRMYHLSAVLYQYLPSDFIKASESIVHLVKNLQKQEEEMSFEYMFLPDFIEKYGIEDFETSVKAIEEITKFTSCEFAIRPFIIKYPDQTIKQIKSWSSHKHAMVRRLASEGIRPRLPWAMALPDFKKDPTSIIPILEDLIEDSSETVRRSVANNFNDISKDNPEIVVAIAKKWKGRSKETDWTVKHACRTLLKDGNQEILRLFGFGAVDQIKVNGFGIHTPKLRIGEFLEFSFQLKNQSAENALIRLEYGIYFQKANGTLSRKVFKISEKEYTGKSSQTVQRRQPFKIITTRKLYPGKHQVAVIINGQEQKKYDFELLP